MEAISNDINCYCIDMDFVDTLYLRFRQRRDALLRHADNGGDAVTEKQLVALLITITITVFFCLLIAEVI